MGGCRRDEKETKTQKQEGAMSMCPTLKLQEHPNQASGCKVKQPMDKGKKVSFSFL